MSTPQLSWSIDLHASPSASDLAADRLFVATTDTAADQTTLRAIAQGGYVMWSRVFERAAVSGLAIQVTNQASPILVALSSTDPLLGEGLVVALSETGETQWCWPSGGQKISAPAIVNGVVYITLDTKILVALDLATGREWPRVDLTVTASLAAPLIVDDVAYLPCRGPRLLALGLDGRQRWAFTLTASDAWFDKTPLIIGSQILAVSSLGEMIVLNRETGALVWQALIGSQRKPLSQPITNGRLIYVGARDGLYALDPSDGRSMWSVPTDRRIEATPALIGDELYVVGHDHRLYVLDAETGREHWRYEVPRRIEVPPLVAPDRSVVYVCDQGGTLTAIARPLTSDDLAAAGRWHEAAEAYAASGQSVLRAQALRSEARQLEAASLDQAALIWEAAAALYSQLGDQAQSQTCRREADRCWGRPALSVAVKYDTARVNHYATLAFSVRNDGFGPARNLIIHVDGDDFKGDLMRTQRITMLPAGQTQTDQLDVRPLCAGHVPLTVRLDYEDQRGELRTLRQKIYVDVTESNTGQPSAHSIDLFSSSRDSSMTPAERESFQRQLKEARANLQIVEERISQYVMATDVNPQYIKQQRQWQARIAELEAKLAGTVSSVSPETRPVPMPRPAIDLAVGIIAICNANGDIVGTGFVAAADLVVTCAHVVEQAGGGPGGSIGVRYHRNGVSQVAHVLAQYWRNAEAEDLAILRLTGALPADVKPLPLGQARGSDKHVFRSLGYPVIGDYEGLAAEGTILTLIRKMGGREMVQLTSSQLARGHSGAPVWDEVQSCVIGMVSEVNEAGKDGKNRDTAFATPIETITRICPELSSAGGQPRVKPDNPFFTNGRINNPAQFFDRERLIREIQSELKKHCSVSLVGESQIGKSSLLYYLFKTSAEWLPGAAVVFVDLQQVFDEADFCEMVLKKLGENGSTLRDLRRALYDRDVVLLLDEVEKLVDKDFSSKLHDLLRALAQGQNFAMCVATQRPLAEVFSPSSLTSPFHNIFTRKLLGVFTETEARRFLAMTLAPTDVMFNSHEIERIIRDSQCQPAKLQRLAKELYDAIAE